MRWVWPIPSVLVERGLPSLRHVPVLLHEGDFPVEANRYVTERCLGEWAPDLDDDEDPTVLTVKSRENLARRLCAFFFWLAQDAKRDWRRLEYSGDEHTLRDGLNNSSTFGENGSPLQG